MDGKSKGDKSKGEYVKLWLSYIAYFEAYSVAQNITVTAKEVRESGVD